MLEHHIQKAIVYALAHAEGLRFSELKPDGLENKLFDYHLKIVIRDGYVEKSEEGTYSLTSEGRRMWLRASKDENWFAETAYSVLFLVIRRASDGAWALAKRKTHPLFDLEGFVHGTPEVDVNIAETARRTCKDKTGLDATFTYNGTGFLRIFNGEELESFTHFTLLSCEDAKGELIEEDELAQYSWVQDPDFSADSMIPNMETLSELYLSGEPFFAEKTIRY